MLLNLSDSRHYNIIFVQHKKINFKWVLDGNQNKISILNLISISHYISNID